MKRVRPEYIKKTYKIDSWSSSQDFLEQIAKKTGKLLKGGEPHITVVSRMILNDWQRGKLPFYVAPEGYEMPKSQSEQKSQETFEKAEVAATNTGDEVYDTKSEAHTFVSESVKKAKEFKQLQDFRKIKVGIEFVQDDIKELDKIDLELLARQKEERAARKKARRSGKSNSQKGGSEEKTNRSYNFIRQI